MTINKSCFSLNVTVRHVDMRMSRRPFPLTFAVWQYNKQELLLLKHCSWWCRYNNVQQLLHLKVWSWCYRYDTEQKLLPVRECSWHCRYDNEQELLHLEISSCCYRYDNKQVLLPLNVIVGISDMTTSKTVFIQLNVCCWGYGYARTTCFPEAILKKLFVCNCLLGCLRSG